MQASGPRRERTRAVNVQVLGPFKINEHLKDWSEEVLSKCFRGFLDLPHCAYVSFQQMEWGSDMGFFFRSALNETSFYVCNNDQSAI